MGYRKGFEAVQESIDAANAAGDFQSFNVTHPAQNPWNMTWKDDPKDPSKAIHTVRFLTDDVITIPFHNFITTRDGGHADFVDTSQLQGELQRPDYIAANFKNDKGKALRPSNQTIALVVERTLNPDTKEWEDVTREFEVLSDPDDANSEKVKVTWPAFWIIKQGMRFWGQVNSYWSDPEMGGTTTNRNFKIKRSGTTAQNTTYTVMPSMQEDGMTAADLADLYQIPALPGYEDDPAQGWIVDWIERRGTEKWFEKLTGPVVARETAPEKKPAAARGSIGIPKATKAPAGKKAAEAPEAAADEPAVDSEAKPSGNLKERLAASYSK